MAATQKWVTSTAIADSNGSAIVAVFVALLTAVAVSGSEFQTYIREQGIETHWPKGRFW